MNLVIIYGAQATGKLTVAMEFSKLTGYKLLHNHLILDLISSVFDYHTEPFNRLTHKFWNEMILEGIRQDEAGIITTFVYGERIGMGDEFTQKMIKSVQENGGTVLPVLLTCDLEEQTKRVSNESRKRYGKLRDVEELKALSIKYDFSVTIPGIESFTIDTTRLSATDVAKKIAEHYHFPIQD
jgi:hypothetical protein